ncbi:hypothetical protein [Planktothricoides raciborskii]|uniref:Uncharacterized protein n=1 Tax=Planktothricoides raciborskii FACHB-1370 TaxID=2949576 RepID=A0ABR8EQF6_9CYAN|nr:hypothetical protein [Planktothricoides raciborskii]MBD2547817.1 hypothetical protein [Planktothricoides raciborskii FACHB-1370]MBD2586255.1 hypothetical protein [Planktothricoides raciborskii FACHB-1261]
MNPQPNSTADRIFAPNVYVFAYALIDGSENQPHTHRTYAVTLYVAY